MLARETPLRALAVAGGVALVCSLLVATAVQWLRPYQLAMSTVDYAAAVLAAASLDLDAAASSDRAVVARYLSFDARIVDLNSGRFDDGVDPLGYDWRSGLDQAAGNRPQYMPVYFVPDELAGATRARIVLPIDGRGMWSNIICLVALEADFTTIAGITVYEHGETPGIGDRIENPVWLASWRGKRVVDASGTPRIALGGADLPDEYRIDSITGATVTTTAVAAAARRWFGDEGYGPLLARLREGGP